MRIAVANVKGGSGKTSLASLLTLTLEAAGSAILASDFDEQGAFTAWLGRMKDSELVALSPTRTKVGKGVVTHEVGDFPPVSPPQLVKMVEGWDVILAPCLPSPMDVQSLAAFITALPDPTRAKVVWNALEVSAMSRPETLAEMLSSHGIKAAKATIPRRACFRYAQMSGLKALDDAAKNAINSLTLEVLNIKTIQDVPIREPLDEQQIKVLKEKIYKKLGIEVTDQKLSDDFKSLSEHKTQNNTRIRQNREKDK